MIGSSLKQLVAEVYVWGREKSGGGPVRVQEYVATQYESGFFESTLTL